MFLLEEMSHFGSSQMSAPLFFSYTNEAAASFFLCWQGLAANTSQKKMSLAPLPVWQVLRVGFSSVSDD